MNKEIKIPEGYEARIDGNKVIIEKLESEDERIRKALIHLINEQDGFLTAIDGISVKDIIAYLEKLKDQKHFSQEVFDSAKYEALCGEQKPVVKCAYPKFRVGDEIIEITPIGYCHPVVVKYVGEGRYNCESKDGKRFLSFPIKNENEYRLIEPQPAEWSEEDENHFKHILNILEYVQGEQMEKGFNNLNSDICWFESLRIHPQPHWKPSDEQMQALNRCLNYLDESDNEDFEIMQELYDKLKKF